MVFRAWDRDNHEKNFCQGTKRVKKVVKKHQNTSKVFRKKKEQQKAQEKKIKKRHARQAKVRQQKRFALLEKTLEKRKSIIEDRKEQERLIKRKIKQRQKERVQKYRDDRERIIQAGVMKLQQIECEHCGKKVAKKDMTKHLRNECPVTMIECGNAFCSIIVQRQDWDFHTHGNRPLCFMCETPRNEFQSMFRSKDKKQTVKGNLGPVPAQACQKLTQLAMQLQARPRLRTKILETFVGEEETLCQIKMVDKVLHVSSGKRIVDWDVFLVKLLQVAKNLMVCEKAGQIGQVMVKELWTCQACWNDDDLPPLTEKKHYRKVSVCPIVFKRQRLLVDRATRPDELECPLGCGKHFKSRHELLHHKKELCKHRMVTCRFGNCGKKYRLSDRESHENDCVHARHNMELLNRGRVQQQMIECVQCGTKCQRKDLKKHQLRCPNRLTPCQFCGEAMGLLKMKQHVATECTAKEIVKQRKLIANARRRIMERIGTAENLVQFWQTKLFDNDDGQVNRSNDSDSDG